MAIPTEKSPQLNRLLSAMQGKDRVQTIVQNRCIQCGDPAEHFTDDLSRKEFRISGLCQRCQDDVWPPGGDE